MFSQKLGSWEAQKDQTKLNERIDNAISTNAFKYILIYILRMFIVDEKTFQ